MFSLQPPRHISTLPNNFVAGTCPPSKATNTLPRALQPMSRVGPLRGLRIRSTRLPLTGGFPLAFRCRFLRRRIRRYP